MAVVVYNRGNVAADTGIKSALIKAYSPHNLRSVGISSKTEFNSVKMAQFTRC